MINFYNKKRELVMVLYDFTFRKEYEYIMRFSTDISYSYFKASTTIQDYKVYLEKFLEELKLLYDSKINIAEFVTLERQLEIYFEQKEYGNILATIKLNHFNIDNVIFESMLMIQYELDQSFLPELITEIEIINKNIDN